VLSGENVNAATSTPTNNVLANTTAVYHDATGGLTTLQPSSVLNTGGSQAHLNMQPFLTLSFCIALQGIFPSAN
jgi:microcystin-dependent protein